MNSCTAAGSLARQLQAIAADTESISALRQGILMLQRNEDPHAQRAGRLWGAAVGAMAMTTESQGEQAATALQQALELYRHGLAAWFAYLEATSDEAAGGAPGQWNDVLMHVAGVCRASQRALGGDESAGPIIDEHVAAAKRSIRAIRYGEAR